MKTTECPHKWMETTTKYDDEDGTRSYLCGYCGQTKLKAACQTHAWIYKEGNPSQVCARCGDTGAFWDN